MLSGWVVEYLVVIEHILARFVPCPTGPAPDPLALEQVALGRRVVLAVAALAHGLNQIVVPQEAGPVHAGELRALAGMNQHRIL